MAHPSLLLFVILMAQLMVVLDATIVNVALPHIQQGLHLSATALSWVINAYILTFGGFLLLGARAGDILGRRRVFLLGILLFCAASLAGGFATSGAMLLVTRAVQGIGGAMAAPSSLALLTTVFPEGPSRMRAIGLYTTVSAAGGAVGLVSGGLLTQLVSWRWVMFVNVPIGIAVLAAGRLVLTETARRHGRLDIAGALSSTLAITCLVLGLVDAGSDGWTAPATIIPLLTGTALVGVFVRNELRAEEPVLPLRLLAHTGRSVANLSRGLVYAGMYGVFFLLSQFLQDVQGYSPLRAGIAFLPMPVSVFVLSQLSSRVLVKRLPRKTVMVSGITLTLLAMLLSTRLGTHTPYYLVLVQLVLQGAGVAIAAVSLTEASLEDVAPADAGAASGLINVVQQVGAAFGVAVSVTVFGSITHHAQLGSSGATTRAAQLLVVHGMDDAFAIGGLFAVAALGMVALAVRPRAKSLSAAG